MDGRTHGQRQNYIPLTSSGDNNKRDMLLTQLILKLGQRSRSQRLKMVQDTQPSQDAFTHQIWDSLLK